jgi:hypothetical protein
VTGPANEIAWAGTELATIWATVDLERSVAEHGLDAAALTAIADSLLGARVVVVVVRSDPLRTLAIAEPNTEGRLAATLARHGEGTAGRYLEVAGGLAAARAQAMSAGIELSRVEDGPFGPAMLVLTRAVTGPHLILCEGSAVPSRP